VLYLTSPAVVLPAGTSFARATFEQWVATEPGFDGGNLSVSVNGGPWQLVPPSEYTFNGYVALLATAAQGNTNPLAGQASWSGNDQGTVNGGSWGRTHLNLASFARAGDSVRLRWAFGTDQCAGRTGWYLDSVSLFSCVPNAPAVSVNDLTVAEGSSAGNAGRTTVQVQVTLSQPTIAPVVVDYEVIDGSAHDGNDFEKAGAGRLVIPASIATTSFIGGAIPIVIKGDTVAEGAETFRVVLRGASLVGVPASAATLAIADGDATVTITDDD
jgi:hypothetical protein